MRSTLARLGLIVVILATSYAPAQDKDDLPAIVPVGKGSYASRPPRDQAARPGVKGQAGWGDLSQVFTNMKLYVPDDYKGPVPSTDWWTSLVTQQWSGQLWAYPGMVKATPAGVAIQFPKTWKLAGNKRTMVLESASRLLVRGKGFAPENAIAEGWSDWLVRMRLAQSPDTWMKATIGHGLPCTWIETSGVDLRLDADNPVFFSATGMMNLPTAGTALGIETNGDCYGIFAPAGTKFSRDGASVAIEFAGNQKWISVALLPSRKDLATFAPYAPVVPRTTKVSWDYSPEKGQVVTTWTLETENLSGAAERNVIQGWIPHHYNTKTGVAPAFTFNDLTYATPRGLMKCAIGNSFQITYPFRGLLPELPAPASIVTKNPYRADVMKSLIDGYTDVKGYGSETYWGGKKILLYAKYMEMAYQLGLTEQAMVFQTKLREALVDWATFEPGEREHFFAMYPNWGSLVGFRTRDNQNPGIDVLQDHAFCYGYHVYAAALLAIHDPQFAKDYGEMARLMVKDYANWDARDTRFPVFRSMDPWCGHSWSGGTGTEAGNGQESSSEAMQAWGAMFTLGSVLDDKPMRDAAVFGYVSEARAVAEYWFDREKTNIPRDLWPHAYNSNLETNGVGWWTWFSGDEYWMHAIQWLPMSPLMKYLSEDPAFAKWDYETMWKNKKNGGFDKELGREAGVGNVTLSYLNIFDPDSAAQIFDQLWDDKKPTAHAKDESGPTYYRIHAGRALGRIKWNAWTDIPTSTVYEDASGKLIAAVYNTQPTEQTCRVFVEGKPVATFTVPARRLIAWSEGSAAPAPLQTVLEYAAPPAAPAPSGAPKLARIEIDPPIAIVSDRGTQRFVAKGFDQYGKPIATNPKWSVQGKGSIDANGVYTPNGAGNWLEARFGIVASDGDVKAHAWAAVEESRRVAKLTLTPPPAREVKLATGASARFDVKVLDQFDARYELPVNWTATGNVTVAPDGRITAGAPGDGTVVAEAGGEKTTIAIKVLRVEDVNLATMKPIEASSSEDANMNASMANDGNDQTRWSSAFADPQWIRVDLEDVYTLNKIALNWENAAAKAYVVEVSTDGTTWTPVANVADGKPGVRAFAIDGVKARYVRINGTKRTTQYGYSLKEIEVFGTR